MTMIYWTAEIPDKYTAKKIFSYSIFLSYFSEKYRKNSQTDTFSENEGSKWIFYFLNEKAFFPFKWSRYISDPIGRF